METISEQLLWLEVNADNFYLARKRQDVSKALLVVNQKMKSSYQSRQESSPILEPENQVEKGVNDFATRCENDKTVWFLLSLGNKSSRGETTSQVDLWGDKRLSSQKLDRRAIKKMGTIVVGPSRRNGEQRLGQVLSAGLSARNYSRR